MTVLADATSDPEPVLKSDDRRLRRFVQNSCLHQVFFFFFKNTFIMLVLILVMLADRLLSN